MARTRMNTAWRIACGRCFVAAALLLTGAATTLPAQMARGSGDAEGGTSTSSRSARRGSAPHGGSPHEGSPHASPAVLPGFTVDGTQKQYQLEAQAAKLMSAVRARELSWQFSREPHVAGTEAEARTRDMFAKYLQAAGIETRIDTFNVYLPHPTNVRLFKLLGDTNVAELSLDEPPIPGDTTITYPAFPAVNGYSAAGDVTGELVYVNYGLIADYATLDSLGISVKGKIAVARYGRSYRGIKAREAERNGAIALLIYSDPAEDGYTRGDVYPEGPMRPKHGIQRGSVYNDNGDPTTPNYPSWPDAPRVPLEKTALPKIPVIPISYDNAQTLLQQVRSKSPLPRGWQGALPFRYHVGPGPVRARLVVETDAQTNGFKNIWNVMGVIRGSEFPDEFIVIGAHRDAWGHGAADNVSGTVSVLETARAIGELVKDGYRPKRTIVFASWDGEEWGLLGSTEYVESDTTRLTRYGVAYLNQDMVAFGSSLGATASPSLRPLFREVAKRVWSPDGFGSVYDAWLRDFRRSDQTVADTAQPVMGDPGGGSDFAGFYNHLGVPMLEWGFGSMQGIYHSHYDSFQWLYTFGDSTFAYHTTAASLGVNALLRLANAEILPYDYVEYARVMRNHAEEAVARVRARGWGEISADTLFNAIARMEAAALAYNALRDSALRRSRPLTALQLRETNERLITVERAFVRSKGLYTRPWFRNVIYAADNDNGYQNITLPTINEAVRAGDYDRTVAEITDLANRFETAAQALRKAAQSLQ